MKASQLCALREDFIREWQRDFPFVPPPLVRGIDRVKETDVIDESQASGHVTTLWDSVHAVDNKLDQLNQQIRRKRRVKDFLIILLRTFDRNFEGKARALSNDDNYNNKSTDSSNVNTVASAGGATIVTVTSSDRRVTPCGDKVYSDKGSVLCVPDECAPATVCKNGPSQSVSCREVNTCEKSCSTELTKGSVFFEDNRVDIGIQCDLFNLNSEVVVVNDSGNDDNDDAFIGYKNIINHKVGSEFGGECVSVNGRCVVESCQNTEVCAGEGGSCHRNKGSDYVDEGESHYDNNSNWILKKATMFKRKKSGGLLRAGDEGGSQRGSKDNFLAVTSQRKLDQEESSSQSNSKDVTSNTSSGSCSRGNSPSLTRNFQLLKLTRGFDLVLDDSDSTDDQSSVDEGDKTSRNVIPDKDNPLQQSSSDKKEVGLKPLETLFIRSTDESDIQKDTKGDGYASADDDDDDDTTPTPVDLKSVKFDYDNSDISNVLDGNPPDLVSSTLSQTAMLTNRTHPGDSSGSSNTERRSPSDAGYHPKRNAAPPPVARKPARSSTGKKLPSIPVGVEPVTRPLTSKREPQSRSDGSNSNDNCTTDPVVLRQSQQENQRQHQQSTNSTASMSSQSNANPSSNLTIINDNKDKNDQPRYNHEEDDTSSNLRSSSTSFLSSSPDFRSALSTGMIPAVPKTDVYIGQSNPNRQSNFFCDIDLDANLSSIPHEQKRTSQSILDPDTTDDSGDGQRSNISDLVRAANSTIIAISSDPTQPDASHNNSTYSQSQNEVSSDSLRGDAKARCGEFEENEKLTPVQLRHDSSTSSASSSSSSAPPLPKRECNNRALSSVISKPNDDERVLINTTTTHGAYAEPDKSNNNNNNNNMIEMASINAAKVDSKFTNNTTTEGLSKGGDDFVATTIQREYSRMSSTDTLVGEQQQQQQKQNQHSIRLRRSESFTSDTDVKDVIFEFDQIISAQCPDLLTFDDLDDPMEAVSKAKRRTSSVVSYENWTINRALTASISSRCRSFMDVTGDDDDNDNDAVIITNDDDSSNASTMPSPDLSRPGYLSHGSKDSGLCDDMSATESAHSDLLDLTGGKISDLRQIQEMERWEEEEEASGKRNERSKSKKTTDTTPPEIETDYDSISITSDIVFLSGSSAKKRPSQDLTGSGIEDVADSNDDDANDNDDDEVDELDGRHAGLDTSSTASSLEGDERSMNASYDETESGHEGLLNLRQLLVKGVLDSEKAFLEILRLLIYYKKTMMASSQSSQPVASDADIQAIFGNIETLNTIHTTFVTSLEAKVKDWTHAECVGEIFKIFVLQFPEFSSYVNNYPNAVNTIHKCSQGSGQFQDIAEKVVFKSTVTENMKLKDALFKPVQRIQRNGLVLHDLIKYTPEDHPDYKSLQRALKLSQHNLESFEDVVPHANNNPENRRLVKSSFLVELVNGVRKLRYMFLFSDIFICTKRETHRNNKVTFQIKWFASLADMTYDTKFAYKDDTKFSKKDDISELKNKIRALKKEMKNEMKKFDDKDKHRSLNIGGPSRTVEKLRKKILQCEGHLILASPKLPFKVSLEGGKVYTLLMTTDYEKEEWKEAINALYKRSSHKETHQTPFSSIFVQDLIDSVKETPQVNKIGKVLHQKDEDILTGTLNVTIHKMNGLTTECDTYCCLEMDSFGHFFMMARTKMCESSRDPNWNEDFELELEGSMTLRILCFKKAEGGDGDQLLGRGALELDKQWLRGSFQEKTISMSEISLVISVRHTPAEKTMQRTPSRTRSAVFGVEISSCARREGKTVPTIITACIHEVEKRGLYEIGIYRVSGVTSDLQRIKKLFDRNISAGALSLEDIDINAVTGILKMYLRELPQPLFTEACYNKFIGTLKLSDDEAKSQCVLRLLHELPDTNYYTIVCLLEHLVTVARYVGQNKMSIHNLSTIFGPTLLAPAKKASTDNDPLALMWLGAEQVMQQSSVVNYLLSLAISGRNLRRSSSLNS